ncbi:jg2547 [Pararge aegeria aegeria]|uniref:Jg2547 protein n=1 Tax=Pararge aegeria aegeria TaxID=348720 RepID=A0A8S4R5V4_9NEOP|nr:jg2547 [Pararge aegeria aegeria]
MRPVLLLFLICLRITHIYSTILTKPFRCFLWDTTCLTALAQNIGPGYIQRIPELASVKLDPLEIDYLQLDQDGLIFEIKDTKVYGLNNLIIDELSASTNISMGRILFRTDLLFTGLYKSNGSMFFQPMNGEGDYWVTLKNLEIELFAPYNIVKNVNGVDFLESSKYSFRHDVKDNAQFRFDNLYYGNTELSELMHSLVNFNWKFVTSQYSRIFVSKVVDCMARAYRSYFQLAPLKSLVEY